MSRVVMQQALEALELAERQLSVVWSTPAAEIAQAITALRAALAEPDLDHCPKCGGPADNGHDRCIPPNPYFCSKCMAEPGSDYERGFVDGMSEQAKRSVDKAVNRMAEQRPIQECYGDCPTNPQTCPNPCNFEGRPKPEKNPFGGDAERYARKLHEWRESYKTIFTEHKLQTTHWEGCEAVHPECKEKNT